NDAVLVRVRLAALARCALSRDDTGKIVRMHSEVPKTSILEPPRLRIPVELLDLRTDVDRARLGIERVHVRDKRQLLDQPLVLLPRAPLLRDVEDDRAVALVALGLERKVRDEVVVRLAVALDIELVHEDRLSALLHLLQERNRAASDVGRKL